MKRTLFLIALIVAAASSALADIARPKNPQKSVAKPKFSYETFLSIRLRADEKEARLIIPKSQIKQLRAQLDALDNGSDNTAATTGTGFSGTQTIMSGLFLSLAIAFAGVWLMRSRSVSANKGIVAAILLSYIASASFVYANAGPPNALRTINGHMFSQTMKDYGFGSGKVIVETTEEDAGQIVLMVPNPKVLPPPGEE